MSANLIELLREARAVLETWRDVVPAVSLCADIDAALAQADRRWEHSKPIGVTCEDRRREEAIDVGLAERNWPCNPRNAARAGWYAALKAASEQQLAAPAVPDAADWGANMRNALDAARYRWLLTNYATGDGFTDIDKALNDGEADTQLSPAIDAAMLAAAPAVPAVLLAWINEGEKIDYDQHLDQWAVGYKAARAWVKMQLDAAPEVKP